MTFWLAVLMLLAFVGLIEAMLGFTIPFLAFRSIILFLLVLGISYNLYVSDNVAKEVEDKLDSKATEAAAS